MKYAIVVSKISEEAIIQVDAENDLEAQLKAKELVKTATFEKVDNIIYSPIILLYDETKIEDLKQWIRDIRGQAGIATLGPIHEIKEKSS